MNATTFDRTCLWQYRAQLLRVIDADTAVLLIDTGFGGRHEVHLRIADLDGPERNTPEGPLAAQRLLGALWSAAETAWPLRVISRQRERVVSEVRSFERFVGDLYVTNAKGELTDVKDLLSHTTTPSEKDPAL